jgi:hypothetical protein
MPLASVNASRYTAPGRGFVLDGLDVIATCLTLRPRVEGWRCWRELHQPALDLCMASLTFCTPRKPIQSVHICVQPPKYPHLSLHPGVFARGTNCLSTFEAG